MKAFIFLILLIPTSLFGAEIDTSAICKVYAPITVQTEQGQKEASQVGTGFVYEEDEEDYFILTNSHILENAGIPRISFYKDDNMTSLANCVVNFRTFQRGTSNDITVLSVHKKNIPYKIKPVNIKLDYNDGKLFGAGYPNGLWLQEWNGYSILSKKKTIGYTNMGPCNGQSGSPVFVDIEGENYVVGMITWRFLNPEVPLPVQNFGGFIKMSHINDVLTGGKNIEKISETAYTPISTTSKYYVIVDSQNRIVSYDIVDGEKIPRFYTENDFTSIQLNPGDAFFPAEQHPVCHGKFRRFLRRMGNAMPTINPPKDPLPPFNKPKQQTIPTEPIKPAPAPKEKNVPNVPEEKQFEESAPKKAEKPDGTELKLSELERELGKAKRELGEAKKEIDRLSSDSLDSQRRIWEQKEKSLEDKISQLEKLIKGKTSTPTKPAPKEEKKGLFGGLFGFLGGLPGKALGGLSDMLGLSQNGVLWSIIGIVGPLLIPAVREFAIARGVSPVALKLGGWLLKIAGVGGKAKKGSDIVSDIIHDVEDRINQKEIIQDVSNPKYDPKDITTPGITVNPNYDGSNVYLTSTTIPTISKENSENDKKQLNNSSENSYNDTETKDTELKDVVDSMEQPVTRLPDSIKQFVDLMISNGEKLETLIMHGNLYREGVRKLREGLLTDKSGAPIQGNQKIAEALERYVRSQYVGRSDYETTQNEYAKDYLIAYRGHLYKEAVKNLAADKLRVLNHIEAAEAIEEYVQNKLYEKMTSIIGEK